MGDLTWLAVLLLFALSFSSLLWSVLAYFPEWRDMAMLTPAFLVISVCLCNKDWRTFDWYLGASWTELSHVDMDHICNALVSMGPNLVLGLGLLVTSQWTNSPYNKRGSYHATLHFDHGNVLHYQEGLDQANWDGTISVLILLYVSNEKC